MAKTNLMTRKVVKPDNDNENNSDHSKQFNIILDIDYTMQDINNGLWAYNSYLFSFCGWSGEHLYIHAGNGIVVVSAIAIRII